jgi:hypothetical protein
MAKHHSHQNRAYDQALWPVNWWYECDLLFACELKHAQQVSLLNHVLSLSSHCNKFSFIKNAEEFPHPHKINEFNHRWKIELCELLYIGLKGSSSRRMTDSPEETMEAKSFRHSEVFSRSEAKGDTSGR